MNKNKVLFLAAVVLAGVSQSAHAYFNFSWSVGSEFGFRAPFFGFPVAVRMHAPVMPHYYPAPVIMQPVPVIYGQPVYHAHRRHSRPARRAVSHPRSRNRRRGGRFANWLGRSSWHVGLNFFA